MDNGMKDGKSLRRVKSLGPYKVTMDDESGAVSQISIRLSTFDEEMDDVIAVIGVDEKGFLGLMDLQPHGSPALKAKTESQLIETIDRAFIHIDEHRLMGDGILIDNDGARHRIEGGWFPLADGLAAAGHDTLSITDKMINMAAFSNVISFSYAILGLLLLVPELGLDVQRTALTSFAGGALFVLGARNFLTTSGLLRGYMRIRAIAPQIERQMDMERHRSKGVRSTITRTRMPVGI